MPLRPGTRLGPYEILSALGAGGMGEVYKAHDTRLDRSVAIKVLPAAFASDPDRLARFEREAKAVAALSHPNILAIFDTGVQDRHAYVVTELLDGETLGERLQSGPLPVRKAIETGVQIARGLAAAHAKGIVHRDLKPANVFVLADGQVKILDFGLAKSMATDSDTTAAAATDPGSIMGTAGYMAPEQVRGQAVDARTDLFAFGAVLYEVLTGQRAFKRDTAAETLTAILNDDPPELTGTRPDLSSALEHIVRHCLEKNSAERFQTARDVAFALEAFSGSATSGAAVAGDDPSASTMTWRRRILLAGAMTVIVAVLVGAGVMAGRRMNDTSMSSPTFTTKTFQRQGLYNARFLPDGRTIVYSAHTQGVVPDLYVQRPDTAEPQRLAVGTGLYSVSTSGELAVHTNAAFATTGGLIGTLARMSVGGAPRAVAEQVRDADWAPDGSLAVIRYVAGKNRIEYPIGTTLYETPHALGGSGASSSGIRVSPDGSQVAFFEHSVEQISVKVVDRFAHVTTLTNAFSAGAGLAWTPDSTTVVFTASEVGTSGELQMYAVAAAAGSPVRRLPQSAGGLEITDLARNGAVLALRQDISTGMVVMLAGAPAERDMSWLNRSENPTLSRDGAWLLFSDVGASTSAGPVTLRRRTDGSPPERLGKGSALGLSPDGKWALSGVQGSESSRVMLYATGPGEPIALPRGPIERVLSADWFPDGRRILVCGNEASHAPRCYVQDVAGGAPKPATAEGMLTTAAPSPDGMRLLGLGPDGVWQIIALDGSPQEIARGLRPDDIAVDWSTDGRAVFVTGNGAVPQRLERVDLLTGARSLIKQLAPVDRVGVTYIAVSSVRDDGREYAYSYYRSLSTLYQIDGLNLSRAP